VSPKRGSLSSISPLQSKRDRSDQPVASTIDILPGSCGHLRVRCALRLLDLGHSFGLFLKPFAPLVSRHELFNPSIPAVDDKHTASRVDCDAVGEIELTLSISKPTPLGDEITFFVEFLNAVVASVRHIDIAGSIHRNAPGRPQLTCFLCERTACVACFGTASPLGQQLWKHVGAGIELLNPVIPHVHDIHKPVCLVHGYTTREVELAVSVPEAAPGHDELSVHIKFLYAEVGAVDHVHISTHSIDCDAPGGVELPFAVSARSELHEIAAKLSIELLDTMIVRVDDPDVALAVACNPSGIVKI